MLAVQVQAARPTIVQAARDSEANMPARGVVATKEDVNAFTDSCVLLRSQWEHFQILFEGSDLKRELLQTTAPTFFRDLHRLFVEHFVQHICRLTDNALTGTNKNLTVKFLIEHSDFSGGPDRLDKLRALSDSIHGFRDLIVEARNKFISHLDLKAVRLGDPLGAAATERWRQFWIDLQDFLDIMHTHHVRADHHFYLNAMGNMSDADSLVAALRNAKLFHAALSDREITMRAMAAADKSIRRRFLACG
jgi:AbiU2